MPLSQENVRLTPDYKQCITKAVGALPLIMAPAKTGMGSMLKAIGAIPSVSRVIVTRNKRTRKYQTSFAVRKKQLTTGAYLHKGKKQSEDTTLMEQLIHNLISSAISCMESGQTIRKSVEDPAKDIAEDDGMKEGIPSNCSKGEYVVITKVLNIREKPSADSVSLSKVYVRDRINIIDSMTNSKGELWAKIDLGDDRVGWVAERYILPDKPIETVFPDTVMAYIDGEEKVLTPLAVWGKPGKGQYTGMSLMTDDNRYNIAIGPKVMNPKYEDDGEIEDDDFEAFDKNVEVIIFNKKTEEEKTLPCFVKDWKAHSYNEYPVAGHSGKAPKIQVIVESGILQTGIRYPYAHNKTEWAPNTFGGNIIEFCSDNTGDINCDDYILRKVIVKLAKKK